MTDEPTLSVIIPTLNEEHYLPNLLASLATINYPMEIIVVDGASEDNTMTVAEAMREKLGAKKLHISIA